MKEKNGIVPFFQQYFLPPPKKCNNVKWMLVHSYTEQSPMNVFHVVFLHLYLPVRKGQLKLCNSFQLHSQLDLSSFLQAGEVKWSTKVVTLYMFFNWELLYQSLFEHWDAYSCVRWPSQDVMAPFHCCLKPTEDQWWVQAADWHWPVSSPNMSGHSFIVHITCITLHYLLPTTLHASLPKPCIR